MNLNAKCQTPSEHANGHFSSKSMQSEISAPKWSNLQACPGNFQALGNQTFSGEPFAMDRFRELAGICWEMLECWDFLYVSSRHGNQPGHDPGYGWESLPIGIRSPIWFATANHHRGVLGRFKFHTRTKNCCRMPRRPTGAAVRETIWRSVGQWHSIALLPGQKQHNWKHA